MKKEYPLYNKGDTNILEGKLLGKDKEIYDKFLTFVSANAAGLKQKDRRKDILQIRDIIDKPFNSWNYEDITEFVALIKESDRKVWTKKGTLITLSIFVKWHWGDWSKTFRNLDIVKKAQKQLVPNNSKRYNEATMPTPEEIDRMIRSADKIWHKLWLSMVAEAGIPFAVQSNLIWDDVKIDSPNDDITTLTYFREKNKNEFCFPLGKTTTYYLKQWQQEYPYPNIKKTDLIFPSPSNREIPITQPTIYTMLNVVSKKSGVNKHMYQYLIRHKVLSDSYGKMSEEIHRKIYGHKPGSKMTATYSHQTNDDTITKALELLHKVKPLTKEEKSEIEKLKKQVSELTTKQTKTNEAIRKVIDITNKLSKNLEVINAVQLVKQSQEKKEKIRFKPV